MANKSVLQQKRAAYQPKLPAVLWGGVKPIFGEPTQAVADCEQIRKLFPNTYGMPLLSFEKDDKAVAADKPLNVGVILSGGQAPGGHNVISGLFDGIKAIHPDSRLYGFLMGPDGLIHHNYIELTADIIDEYRNTGGFDIIGSGRTKLEKKEQFDSGLVILKQLGISALVIIGGDDSNTNAALLAEYYKSINAGVQVIGCPKTIDGDLKNEQIETSFGFDTATKVYSEVIGNIQRDCNSAKKYWHFIKLMGRSASHIALECALQCQPNICLISEEIQAKNMTLDEIVDYIARIVRERHKDGKHFGVALIPEGLIEFIPATAKLISKLNQTLPKCEEFPTMSLEQQRAYVQSICDDDELAALNSLPQRVADQLMLDRDPHGNVQVSLIETEKLLSSKVAQRIAELDNQEYGNLPENERKQKRTKFSPLHHFFGYEGRCADPSNFDADYCYALGYNASRLIACGVTGYMSSVRNLTKPSAQWLAGGIPVTMMMNMENRAGKDVPVIRKALVDLNGRPFKEFAAQRDRWAQQTCYLYPGPIQYFGSEEVCDQPSRTLFYEHQD